MLAMLIENRCRIRGIACVAVLLLYVGALEASPHGHGEECGGEVCAVCLFTDSGSAAPGISEQPGSRLLRVSAPVAPQYLLAASRPFEPRRTRAPPIS